MGVNSLPKTVTRQRRGCDLNPGPSAPESSTLTTRLPSHPVKDRRGYYDATDSVRLCPCCSEAASLKSGETLVGAASKTSVRRMISTTWRRVSTDQLTAIS